MDVQETGTCWCGNLQPIYFSAEYSLCDSCQTVISKAGLTQEETLVKNDETDFYGKNYWLKHQSNDLGFPNIYQRSRSDLSDRCLHWLRVMLKYRLPPASTLELGCAHGGFVSLLQSCGFDAAGLELSPWIAKFAQETFNIRTLIGPVEEQNIAPASLDVIALMDVLEHLPDPKKVMSECLKLLKPDGFLLIQTPKYPIGKTYEAMVTEQSVFLSQLISDEHLFLFSQQAVIKLFQELGSQPVYMEFEPAIFPYDMFFVVSKTPIKINSPEQIDAYLASSPQTRHIQAMLDLADKYNHLYKLYCESEIDRANRLDAINHLSKLYHESEIDRASRLEVINNLTRLNNELSNKIREAN